MTTATTRTGFRDLIGSTAARASLPTRTRVIVSFVVIAMLHLVGAGLLLAAGAQALALASLALVAYGRGLVHALDFDHVSMIDNSIRKFVAEDRRPVSVGLAFSSGHSAVVLISSALVIAGFSAVTAALNPDSTAGAVLGIVGLTCSGLYLLLCALANLPRLASAIRLYRGGASATDAGLREAARPGGGLISRLLGTPLRWVKHPRHVFAVGFAFSLGFDTSSQIGVLVVLAGASVAGAPLIALMAIPVFFTAGITLLDTVNGMYMLRVYSATGGGERRMLLWNIIVTAIGVASAVLVAALAAAELTSAAGSDALARAFAWYDGEWAGPALAAVFIVVGGISLVLARRRRHSPS